MADGTVAKIRLALEGANAVETGLSKVEQKVAGLGKELIGLGGALSAAALVAWTRNAINTADETAKLAQRVGLLTNEVGGLQLAFRQAGAGEALQQSLSYLSKEAAGSAKSLKAMGIESKATDGSLKGTRTLLAEVADKFSTYRDGAEKTALAMKIFGRSGADIIPLLNAGSKGLEDYDEKARRLGLTLDTETAKAAERFNDNLDLSAQRVQGVALQIATGLLPALEELSELMAEAAQEGGNFEVVGEGVSVVLETIAVLAVNTNYVLQQTGDTLGGLVAAYQAFFTGNFEGAREIGRQMRENGEIARREVDATIARILNARKVAASLKGADDYDEPWVKRLKAGAGGGVAAPIVSDGGSAGGAAAAAERARREAAREAAREEKEHAQWLLSMLQAEDAYRQNMFTKRMDEQDKLAQSARDAYAEQIKAYTDSAASVQQTLQNYLLENEAIALSERLQISVAQAVELTTIARLEEAKVAAMGSEEAVLAIQKEIDARRQLAQAINSRDVKEASTKAAKEAADAWEKTAGKIGDTLTDALMRGFESGEGFGENLADSIVNTFKTYVAKEISATITKAIMSALANTQWGNALGSILGGASGGGGTDWISLALKGYQYMSGGSTAATAAAYGTTVGSQQTTMLMAQEAGMGTAAGGGSASAAGIGAMGWAAIIAAAIYAGSELYDAGYDRTNLQGIGEDNRYSYGVENLLYKINEQTGLLNEKWANVFSGTTRMAHMFGYKLHQTGIRGNFDGAGGIQTDQYESYKGGWLRGGDKVFSAPMEAERAQRLTNSLADIQDSTEVLVRAMGGNADAVRDFAGSVTIDLRGLTQSEAAAKMAEEFQDLQFRMAEAAGISRDAFAQMMAMAQGLGERFGATGPAIADLLVQGMTGRLSAGDLQAQLADVIMGGIYNSVASVYADPIAQMFQSQIIQPILTAALAGAPLAGIVSQATMQGVVNQARQSMAALNQIFSDPAFKQFMSELEGTIKQVSTISVQPAKHIKSFGTAALNAGNAAKAARQAWVALTNTIIDEVRRLRGVIVGDTSAGLAYTQAQFAIATAQARSGNKDAASQLPEISRALEELLRENSDSLSDFRAGLAANMVSLSETSRILAKRYGFKLPSMAVGTNYLPSDMLIQAHEGEAIVPKAYNPAAGGVDNAQLYRVMSELLAETKLLRESNHQVATNTRGTTDILDRVTQGGEAVLTEEVT